MQNDTFYLALTWQSIITAGAVVAAMTTLITLLVKVVRWFDRQKKQDAEIKALQEKHDADIRDLKHEQLLSIKGILAALQGLSEQGCNGPVTEAIKEISTYLNEKAHNEECSR